MKLLWVLRSADQFFKFRSEGQDQIGNDFTIFFFKSIEPRQVYTNALTYRKQKENRRRVINRLFHRVILVYFLREIHMSENVIPHFFAVENFYIVFFNWVHFLYRRRNQIRTKMEKTGTFLIFENLKYVRVNSNVTKSYNFIISNV